MSGAASRFVLHEEDGIFGVFDRVGPQIFFASSRAEAVREVERANEIVRLHPTTISMRHLREMDAAWRRVNGLPPLPEPQGRTVVVPAEVPLPATTAVGLQPQVPGRSVAAVLDTAGRVAEREAIRGRVEDARLALKRTRARGRELTRAWAASEPSIARMRTGLREIYGPSAGEAERELRDLLRSADPARGAREYTTAAVRHLSRTAPPAAGSAVQIVAACAPAVAAWDRALDSAASASGAALRPGGDRARYNAVLTALHRVREADEQTLASARASNSAAASGPGPRVLRDQWRALSPADRAAVLQVLPEVTELVRPPRTRGRGGPSAGGGGFSR